MCVCVAEVQNVGVEVLSGSSVRVTWDNPGSQGISNYVVYYRQTSNRKRQTQEMNVVVPATASSARIDNLEYGAVYVFEVVARVNLGGKTVEGSRVGPELLVFTTVPPVTAAPPSCKSSS